MPCGVCKTITFCKARFCRANRLKHKGLDSCKTQLHNRLVKIGYARISTDEQSLNLQRDALNRAGCVDVFEDKGVSGTVVKRPGLDAALARLGQDDVLTVWKLDRLGRSLPHLIDTVRQIGERGAGFASLSEAIDTTTAGGKLVFHIMGALAEFERSLIVERVSAGIAAAKDRGQHVGRPRKLTRSQILHAQDCIEHGSKTLNSMAVILNVDQSTLWRAIDREKYNVLIKAAES